MVLGTVSATNAASQQLRLDYITTKPLSSFSAFKDALPEQQRDLLWTVFELPTYVLNPLNYLRVEAFASKLWKPVVHFCPIHAS